MAKFLAYTTPARGHLFPVMPTLLELARRGHQVVVRTLSSEVERVRAQGLGAAPIDPRIEAREIDDWKAKSPPDAMLAAIRTFVARAPFEIEELRAAVAAERPDALFIDVNAWGAAAFAQTSGLPWATFAPFFQPVRGEGVPPWGMGLKPRRGPLGALRDAVLWKLLDALYDRGLPELNAVRQSVGAAPLRHVAELTLASPCVISYTAEPFEYPRAWPEHFHLVGPGVWEPASGEALTAHTGPLVLVTCSTEFQNDAKLIEVALEALADEPVRVVATTAAIDPSTFKAPPNARVERFLPHGPLLAQASCVVCHGGMGITQKALSAGVPLCVVPFGRDQVEVARHVEVANAGTRLSPSSLTPVRLRDAVRKAMGMRPGAQAIAEAFRSAGGAARAATVLEGLVK